MIEFLTSTDFWSIVLKALITTLLTLAVGAGCTLLGKLIANCKNSKLRRHAKIAVEAAEAKFPNEGRKMGPEKIAYVMDYLSITFPKIKSNQYLYNIAEAAVYELNTGKQKQEAKIKFKEKYGELPGDLTQDIPDSSEADSTQDIIEQPLINNQLEAEEKSSDESISFNLKAF